LLYQSAPIASERSPLLTNGHGLGGELDQKWVEGMPLGEAFLRVMMTAWNVQQARRRENLNPKSVPVMCVTRMYSYGADCSVLGQS
jgi:ubiquitin carboxyl-terminal hydrolase 16/45